MKADAPAATVSSRVLRTHEHFPSRCWPVQTRPKDCLPQCGNKRLCQLDVTPSISILGSHLLEAPFCLYTAWLLTQIRHAGYSRLFPHWCKGCFGHVWASAPSCGTSSTRDTFPSAYTWCGMMRSWRRVSARAGSAGARVVGCRTIGMGRLLPLRVHERQDWPRSWRRPLLAVSGPRPHTAAPEARHVQGLRRDAAGSPGLRRSARPMSSTLDFRMVRSNKYTCSGPCPHRRGGLFCLGASAHGVGHCLKACPGSEPHARFDHHVKAVCGAVPWGWLSSSH